MFLEICQNSQENTSARVSFLTKLQAAPATLLKKRLWHRCFSVNFDKFLRTPFSQNTSGLLLLKVEILIYMQDQYLSATSNINLSPTQSKNIKILFKCDIWKNLQNFLLKQLKFLKNKNNQKVSISFQIQNDKNKIWNIFVYSKLISRMTFFSSHFQIKINKTYVQVKL